MARVSLMAVNLWTDGHAGDGRILVNAPGVLNFLLLAEFSTPDVPTDRDVSRRTLCGILSANTRWSGYAYRSDRIHDPYRSPN
jgi:hypothetical protein